MSRILREDSVCIDIGCNRGRFLREVVRLAPKGTHYAFEPIPEFAEDLRRMFSTAHIVEAALSDVLGEATFYYMKERTGHSGLWRREWVKLSKEARSAAAFDTSAEELFELLAAECGLRISSLETGSSAGIAEQAGVLGREASLVLPGSRRRSLTSSVEGEVVDGEPAGARPAGVEHRPSRPSRIWR
jgi:FkbM family methyltransferase